MPETSALLKERFDHIMYTGNGSVAKIVMEAAVKNLTPVTLELGGKSPCIVDRTADLKVAARRIAWGKFMNAGQTCIAPDYILAEESIEEELIGEIKKSVETFYSGNTQDNPDYTRIVNSRHHERVSKLIEGQEVAFGGRTRAEDCYIEPTVLRNVSPDSPVMQSEIFGPVLPVLRIKDVDEAIEFVNRGEKPLALSISSAMIPPCRRARPVLDEFRWGHHQWDDHAHRQLQAAFRRGRAQWHGGLSWPAIRLRPSATEKRCCKRGFQVRSEDDVPPLHRVSNEE